MKKLSFIKLTKEELDNMLEFARQQGYDQGYSYGYDKGYDSGKHAEYKIA